MFQQPKWMTPAEASAAIKETDGAIEAFKLNIQMVAESFVRENWLISRGKGNMSVLHEMKPTVSKRMARALSVWLSKSNRKDIHEEMGVCLDGLTVPSPNRRASTYMQNILSFLGDAGASLVSEAAMAVTLPELVSKGPNGFPRYNFKGKLGICKNCFPCLKRLLRLWWDCGGPEFMKIGHVYPLSLDPDKVVEQMDSLKAIDRSILVMLSSKMECECPKDERKECSSYWPQAILDIEAEMDGMDGFQDIEGWYFWGRSLDGEMMFSLKHFADKLEISPLKMESIVREREIQTKQDKGYEFAKNYELLSALMTLEVDDVGPCAKRWLEQYKGSVIDFAMNSEEVRLAMENIGLDFSPTG